MIQHFSNSQIYFPVSWIGNVSAKNVKFGPLKNYRLYGMFSQWQSWPDFLGGKKKEEVNILKKSYPKLWSAKNKCTVQKCCFLFRKTHLGKQVCSCNNVSIQRTQRVCVWTSSMIHFKELTWIPHSRRTGNRRVLLLGDGYLWQTCQPLVTLHVILDEQEKPLHVTLSWNARKKRERRGRRERREGKTARISFCTCAVPWS